MICHDDCGKLIFQAWFVSFNFNFRNNIIFVLTFGFTKLQSFFMNVLFNEICFRKCLAEGKAKPNRRMQQAVLLNIGK